MRGSQAVALKDCARALGNEVLGVGDLTVPLHRDAALGQCTNKVNGRVPNHATKGCKEWGLQGWLDGTVHAERIAGFAQVRGVDGRGKK